MRCKGCRLSQRTKPQRFPAVYHPRDRPFRSPPMRFCRLLSSLLPILCAVQVAGGQAVVKWALGGSNPTGYTMSANGSPMTDEGATLTLQSTSPTVTGFGVATATIRADTLAGRRVRISADIETKDVAKSASLWLRADSGRTMLVLDNGMDRGIKGNSAPSHMDVTVNVPGSATSLWFGLLLSGGGEATARHVRITARPPISADAPLAP